MVRAVLHYPREVMLLSFHLLNQGCSTAKWLEAACHMGHTTGSHLLHQWGPHIMQAAPLGSAQWEGYTSGAIMLV